MLVKIDLSYCYPKSEGFLNDLYLFQLIVLDQKTLQHHNQLPDFEARKLEATQFHLFLQSSQVRRMSIGGESTVAPSPSVEASTKIGGGRVYEHKHNFGGGLSCGRQ